MVLEMIRKENEELINRGRQEGRRVGRQEGIRQERIGIVKRLLTKKYNIDEIKDITGISKREIQEIAKNAV